MKSLRKTILFLSDTLRWRDKRGPAGVDGKSLVTPVQKNDSEDVFGGKREYSKLSTSYKAIKRMTYQQWQ